jgi:hypothetical protein
MLDDRATVRWQALIVMGVGLVVGRPCPEAGWCCS